MKTKTNLEKYRESVGVSKTALSVATFTHKRYLSDVEAGRGRMYVVLRYAAAMEMDPVAVVALSANIISHPDELDGVKRQQAEHPDYLSVVFACHRPGEALTNAIEALRINSAEYYRWKSGQGSIYLDRLMKVADAFGVSALDAAVWAVAREQGRGGVSLRGAQSVNLSDVKPVVSVEAASGKKPAGTVIDAPRRMLTDVFSDALLAAGAEALDTDPRTLEAIAARVVFPKPRAICRLARGIHAEPTAFWLWLTGDPEPDEPELFTASDSPSVLREMVEYVCDGHSLDWFANEYGIARYHLDLALDRVEIPTHALIKIARAVEVPPVSLWRWIARV